MGLLAAARAAQEVDREIRGDPVEPRVERVPLVVAVDFLPHAQEDHLGDVPGVLDVADDAAGQRDHGRRLARNQRLEGEHVAAPRPDGQVAVGQLREPLPLEPFAVDEFHGPERSPPAGYTDQPPGRWGFWPTLSH